MITEIKVGRKSYEVKKGDYILHNGSSYQFISGDGRTLKFEKFARINGLALSKKDLSLIDLTELCEQKRIFGGVECICYLF